MNLSWLRPLLLALFGGFLVTLGSTDGAYAQTASTAILCTLDFSTQGSQPNPPVIGPDGNLYTTTRYGGASGSGTVLQITPAGAVTVLHTIDGQTEGQFPAPITFGGDGALYGTTFGATIFRITTGGEYATLFTAPSGEETSYNGLVEGADGNLYGCLTSGGSPSILFEMTPGGSMTTLHTFTSAEVNSNPSDTVLASGSDGNVYGMTEPAGTSTGPHGSPVAYGIFFRATGGYELLHVFSGGAADGAANALTVLNPLKAGFVFLGLNSLSSGGYTYPTLSEIGTDGTVTIIHEYDANSTYSTYGLLGGDGNFYFAKGTSGTPDSLSLFRTSADGSTTTTLGMLALPDGDSATNNPLTAAGDGSFYGVTELSIFRTAIYAPTKPVVTISAAPTKIDEKGGVRAKVIVHRSGDDLTSPLKVELKFGATAINGKDYKKIAPTVTIPAGSSVGFLHVKALNVGRKGGHQTVNISVTARANGSYTVGRPSKATINIKNNS